MHRNNTDPVHSGTKTGVLSGVFLVAAMAPALGSAAWINCPASIAAHVTDSGGTNNASAACQYASDATQDFTNTDPITVNEPPPLFGFSDWSFGVRDETPDAIGQNGQWDVSSLLSEVSVSDTAALFDAYDVSLVFKDGANTTLVGYLLNEQYSMGDWSSPFIEPPFPVGDGKVKDNSHISYYYRTNPGGGFNPPQNETPVPAPLALIGLGAILLGWTRYLRRV